MTAAVHPPSPPPRRAALLPDDDLDDDLPNLDPIGAGSRVACERAWNDAAFMIARGETMTAVAEHLRCSRSTLWRTLQRSERLRTRIAEERRYLAVEAASRFKGLHGAALEAIEAAVRRGDLRAAIWVAEKLGLARRDIADARRGIEDTKLDALCGTPPRGPELFVLDTPLALEEEVRAHLAEVADADLAAWREHSEEARLLPRGTDGLADGPPETQSEEPAAAPPATLRENRPTLLHGMPDADLLKLPPPDLADLLKALPATDAAWPDVRRGVRLAHAAFASRPKPPNPRTGSRRGKRRR